MWNQHENVVTEYDTEETEVCLFFSMIYNIKNVLNICIRVGLRTVLFWVIVQRGVVISYRRFGKPIFPIFKGIITQKSAVLIYFAAEGFLIPKYGTDRLSWNVCKKLPELTM
jgi:hypothetical protein